MTLHSHVLIVWYGIVYSLLDWPSSHLWDETIIQDRLSKSHPLLSTPKCACLPSFVHSSVSFSSGSPPEQSFCAPCDMTHTFRALHRQFIHTPRTKVHASFLDPTCTCWSWAVMVQLRLSWADPCFFPGVRLWMKLLDHMITLYSTFWETDNLFSYSI